ncbi:MAG: SPOR domain-containing protein, partial [Acidobacteriota bacterium]
EGSFTKDIEQWVAQDLGPPSRTPSHPSALFNDDAPIAAPPQRRVTSNTPRQEVPTRIIKTDWPKDVRSGIYVHKLFRVWARRAAIAMAAFMIFTAVMAGDSLLSSAMNPGELPATPDRPAPAMPGLVLREVPPDVPVTNAAPVAASAGYIVAVGLFASPERAQQLVDDLARTGLPATQRSLEPGNRQLNQIVLGPFLTRADAAEDLRRLQKLGGFDDARIVDGSK